MTGFGTLYLYRDVRLLLVVQVWYQDFTGFLIFSQWTPLWPRHSWDAPHAPQLTTAAPWQFNEQGSEPISLLLPCTSPGHQASYFIPLCALGPSVVMVTLGKALDLSWPIAVSVTAYFSYYPHTNLCFCTSCLYLDSLSPCLHLYGLSFHCHQVSGYMSNITKKLLC